MSDVYANDGGSWVPFPGVTGWRMKVSPPFGGLFGAPRLAVAVWNGKAKEGDCIRKAVSVLAENEAEAIDKATPALIEWIEQKVDRAEGSSMTEREEQLIQLLRACKPLIVAEARWTYGQRLLNQYEDIVSEDAEMLHERAMIEMGYVKVGPKSWELDRSK